MGVFPSNYQNILKKKQATENKKQHGSSIRLDKLDQLKTRVHKQTK